MKPMFSRLAILVAFCICLLFLLGKWGQGGPETERRDSVSIGNKTEPAKPSEVVDTKMATNVRGNARSNSEAKQDRLATLAWDTLEVDELLAQLRPDFQRDPQGLLDSLSRQPTSLAKREALEVLLFADWAKSDPHAAIAAARHCQFLGPENKKASPVRVAVNQWAAISPSEAVNWIVESPWYGALQEDHRKSVEAVFISWGRQSPDHALDWLAANRSRLGQSRDTAIEVLAFTTAASSRDFVTAREIAQLHPMPAKCDELLREIAQMERLK